MDGIHQGLRGRNYHAVYHGSEGQVPRSQQPSPNAAKGTDAKKISGMTNEKGKVSSK